MNTFHDTHNQHRKQRIATWLTQAANIGRGESLAARINLLVAHEDYKEKGHLGIVQNHLRLAIERAHHAGWVVKNYSTRYIDVERGAGEGMLLWAQAFAKWMKNPTLENEQAVVKIYRYEKVFSNTWTVWRQSDYEWPDLWSTLEPWEKQEYADGMLHHTAGGARQKELALEALAELGL